VADYLATKDWLLLPWAQNFSGLITSTPTAFSLTSAMATNLANLVSDFETRLVAATEPGTRSKVTVQAKRISKASLTSIIRQYARIINSAVTTTDTQRVDLGLHVRDAEPTPNGPPTVQPQVSIRGTAGNQALLKIAAADASSTRGRPAGTSGATVSYKIGPLTAPAPTSAADCQLGGLATRTTYVLPIPPGSAGQMLWVMAQYYNDKGDLGPVSLAAGTVIAA